MGSSEPSRSTVSCSGLSAEPDAWAAAANLSISMTPSRAIHHSKPPYSCRYHLPEQRDLLVSEVHGHLHGAVCLSPLERQDPFAVVRVVAEADPGLRPYICPPFAEGDRPLHVHLVQITGVSGERDLNQHELIERVGAEVRIHLSDALGDEPG